MKKLLLPPHHPRLSALLLTKEKSQQFTVSLHHPTSAEITLPLPITEIHPQRSPKIAGNLHATFPQAGNPWHLRQQRRSLYFILFVVFILCQWKGWQGMSGGSEGSWFSKSVLSLGVKLRLEALAGSPVPCRAISQALKVCVLNAGVTSRGINTEGLWLLLLHRVKKHLEANTPIASAFSIVISQLKLAK